MSSPIANLFRTPSGWAVLIAGAAVLLWIGTKRREHNADLFVPSSEYDFRNNHQVVQENIPQLNPYNHAQVTGIRIPKSNGKR